MCIWIKPVCSVCHRGMGIRTTVRCGAYLQAQANGDERLGTPCPFVDEEEENQDGGRCTKCWASKVKEDRERDKRRNRRDGGGGGSAAAA